ncbi:MAG: methionyl-tRNA formyltransferase [Turneriella sp.]
MENSSPFSNQRIIFAGFGTLGKVCLEALVKNDWKIALVLTHKDDTDSSLSSYCRNLGINQSLEDARKSKLLRQQISSLGVVDFIVSINYRYILPMAVLSGAKTAFNIHGSLLPQYRGRTPHVWAIINGESEAGVTAHIMTDKVDAGDIITQTRIPIEELDTGYALLKKYESAYPACLIESLRILQAGKQLTPQSTVQGSYFGKRTADMGYIDFRLPGLAVINFIRAQAKPYPGAYAFFPDGSKVIVHRAVFAGQRMGGHEKLVGQLFFENKKLYVHCSDAVIEFVEFEIT